MMGTFFGGPNNKGHSSLGSILGSHYFEGTTIRSGI